MLAWVREAELQKKGLRNFRFPAGIDVKLRGFIDNDSLLTPLKSFNSWLNSTYISNTIIYIPVFNVVLFSYFQFADFYSMTVNKCQRFALKPPTFTHGLHKVFPFFQSSLLFFLHYCAYVFCIYLIGSWWWCRVVKWWKKRISSQPRFFLSESMYRKTSK